MGYASCPSGHESRKLGVCGERQSQVPVWLGRVIIATLISGIILLGTVIPACAAPNHITWSVPAGTNPIAVAVNKTTNKTYVANQGSNNVTIIDGSGSTNTIAAGNHPYAVAVNETTNKAYVANFSGNNMTIIDGSGSTTTVAAGTYPTAVAVNKVTDKAYVVNQGSNNVTVIDGSGSTTTIPAGDHPFALAVNETTNKVYVANIVSNNVTVIDGSGSTTTITAGNFPNAVAVNEVTNKAYITNMNSDNVTVIDGSGSTTTVAAGTQPYAVAVNEVTNKAYVANNGSNDVTVIDGSGSTTTVAAGTQPQAVAVNEATNKAYVANFSNDVTVIDGSGSTTTVAAGTQPQAVAVNEVTNKAYVANNGSNTVTVVDGSGSTTTVAAGAGPCAVAVNGTTNKAYVANHNSNNVTVIDGSGSTTTVTASNPNAVAVNETTNKAYVLNFVGNNVTVIDGSGSTTTVAAGTEPFAVAINETTNKAYVVNYLGNNVTVIDGSGSTTTVAAGSYPRAVAVNETTNKTYVVNEQSNNVTVIDGSGSTTTVAAGSFPWAVAVNETTNKAYVANYGSNNVTVIDGSGSTTTIATGTGPRAVAIDETTNKAYVANSGSNNVTVIDGSGSTTTVAAGTGPEAVAVNEATNKAFVANMNSDNVTVIDGSGSTTTVATGTQPQAVAVNEVTNKAYVANFSGNNVTVISYNIKPTVTTRTPSSVTSLGATSGGNVTSDGWDPVTARGVCWSTSHNPTTHNSHTADGTGTGTFTSNITGLNPGTHYCVRAYAMNGVGTAYGAEESFTSQPPEPPRITSISPARGPIGSTVTINGNNFGTRYTSGRGIKYALSSACCMFNQTQCVDYTSWTNTQIKCKVPQGAVPGPVRVITGKGASNANFTFTPTYSLTPLYYLAEGSTAHGFSTFINIENPTDEDLNCSVNFLLSNGKVVSQGVGLPKNSQTTVNPEDFIGEQDFSTRVDCVQGKMIAVDRTMVWRGEGAPSPEAHSSIGTTSPQKIWYLAEGSSNWGFETWTLVENPNDRPTKVTLSYMLSGGGVKELEKTIPANARASYSMQADIGGADASVLVTSDLPVVTERSMYRNNRREGSCSIGTPSPGSNFYLAEGTSAWGFNTFVLIQNPNPTPATITLTYMTSKGASPQAPFTMAPFSRKTVLANDSIKDTDFSIQVSTDKPVVAERAMYWGADTPLGEACHASSGVCSSHETFYLPDGSTQEGVETYTLVENPNSTAVQIEFSYLMPGGKDNITFTDTLKPNSRKTYSMADKVPGGRASIRVTSKTPNEGIVVERSMYWNNRGAGTDTIGAYVDNN